MSLLYIPHHIPDDGTGSCKLIHFSVLGILVLGFHENLFDCCVSFKVYLYAILTTCLFYTFGYSLCVWMTICPTVALFPCLFMVGLLSWLLLFLFPLLLSHVILLLVELLLLVSSQMLFKTFSCTLLMAQVG